MSHSPPIPRDPVDRKPTTIVPTCDCFVNKGMTFDRQLGIHFCALCGAYEDSSQRSTHQQRIEEFMTGINHQVADVPTIPTADVRKLRARIILEEALETIQALGFAIVTHSGQVVLMSKIDILESFIPDLIEIADGCGDLSVVTIGTLAACGIPDKPILEAVDQNNLTKVKPLCPECRYPMVKRYNGDPDTDSSAEHTGWVCLSDTHYGAQYPKEVGGYEREDGKWVKGTAHRKVDLAKVLEKLSQ